MNPCQRAPVSWPTGWDFRRFISSGTHWAALSSSTLLQLPMGSGFHCRLGKEAGAVWGLLLWLAGQLPPRGWWSAWGERKRGSLLKVCQPLNPGPFFWGRERASAAIIQDQYALLALAWLRSTFLFRQNRSYKIGSHFQQGLFPKGLLQKAA